MLPNVLPCLPGQCLSVCLLVCTAFSFSQFINSVTNLLASLLLVMGDQELQAPALTVGLMLPSGLNKSLLLIHLIKRCVPLLDAAILCRCFMKPYRGHTVSHHRNSLHRCHPNPSIWPRINSPKRLGFVHAPASPISMFCWFFFLYYRP